MQIDGAAEMLTLLEKRPKCYFNIYNVVLIEPEKHCSKLKDIKFVLKIWFKIQSSLLHLRSPKDMPTKTNLWEYA